MGVSKVKIIILNWRWLHSSLHSIFWDFSTLNYCWIEFEYTHSHTIKLVMNLNVDFQKSIHLNLDFANQWIRIFKKWKNPTLLQTRHREWASLFISNYVIDIRDAVLVQSLSNAPITLVHWAVSLRTNQVNLANITNQCPTVQQSSNPGEK